MKEQSMQIIPADWQITIDDHIVSMMDHFESAVSAREVHNSPSYITACDDLVRYVRQAFGSAHNFDQFLKADLLHALEAKGYQASISEDWNDGHLKKGFLTTQSEAEELYATYTIIYKKSLEDVASMPVQTTRTMQLV